jgi:hypothetical protein
MASDRRMTVLEMIGEFLREAGVLILVFGFLERTIDSSGTHHPSSVAIVGLSAACFVAGVIFERVRGER